MMKNNKHLSLSIHREHYENIMHFSLLTIVTKISKINNKQKLDNKQQLDNKQRLDNKQKHVFDEYIKTIR